MDKEEQPSTLLGLYVKFWMRGHDQHKVLGPWWPGASRIPSHRYWSINNIHIHSESE